MRSPTSAPSAKRVFLVFEGGGAKGIVHVGALRALEEWGVEICGVAGTSAGAIVSALIAAGYRSHDLIAADGSSPVLRSLGLNHATDFFGRDWRKLAAARWAAKHWPTAILISSFPAALAASLLLWTVGGGVAEWILAFLLGFVVLLVVSAYRLAHGLTRLDLLVAKLDAAMAAKLGRPPGELVRFRDLDEVGRPLRVVATDLASRSLKLFSSAHTPEVSVAEAVAASAALPLACRHRTIDNRPYIDGGIVSNLPAWTFDEERALDPDALTITICIADGRVASDRAKTSPHRILASIVLAAIFGRRHLETRAASRLLNMTVPTDIRLVDFDMSRQQAGAAVKNARDAAEARLGAALFVLPSLFDEACGRLRKQVDDLVRTPAALPPGARTRVMVALRDPGSIASWRIRYGVGLLPTDADDQILLPEESSVVGRAVKLGAPVLEAKPFSFLLSGAANRYRNAMIRADLAWCLAIPIYAQDAAEGAAALAVVAVDSNVDVTYFGFDVAVVTALAAAATVQIRPVVKFAMELE